MVVHVETSVSVGEIIFNYLCFLFHPLVQTIERIMHMIQLVDIYKLSDFINHIKAHYYIKINSDMGNYKTAMEHNWNFRVLCDT
jgi:hypothetical protein